MGLQTQLGLTTRPPNWLQRAVQRLGSTKVGSWVFSKTLAPVDLAINRLSRGKLNAPELLGGFPVIMLTTTGRRSGQNRTSPLVGIPSAGELAVIGSNFGQPAAPGWVFNLESTPSCSVGYFNQTAQCVAQELTPHQAERVFVDAAKIYPGFDKYRQRVNNRQIKVFLIRPEQV